MSCFSLDEKPEKSYGSTVIKLNIDRLRADIASGKLKDVHIMTHEEIIEMHADAVAKAQALYDLSIAAKRSANAIDQNLKKVRSAERDMRKALLHNSRCRLQQWRIIEG